METDFANVGGIAPDPAYSAKYEYWCGIDVNNGNDYTCDVVDDDAARHYGPVTFATSRRSNDTYSKSHRFSSARSKRPFPMVKVSINWPGYGVTVHGKMRGWDIAYSTTSNTWKLTKEAKY